MKVALTQSGPSAFSLTLGDTDVEIDAAGLKALLVEITRVLAPGANIAESEEDKAQAFISRMRGANDLGIQKMLVICQHDDVLALLKAGENDEALQRKFYGNMSERSRKIFVEDMIYKFADGLPSGQLRKAVENLSHCASQLEADGTLTFQKIVQTAAPENKDD